MPKRSIFRNSKKYMMKKETKEEKVFNYIARYKRKWYSQSDIAKALDISQPTVSNILKKLQSNRFPYGKSEYLVSKKDEKYAVVKLEDLAAGLMENATEEKRNKFEDALIHEEDKLMDLNTRTKDKAERITRTVILYRLSSKMLQTVKNSLYTLYNKYIYDVVSCDKGLYIILREEKKDDKLLPVANSILELYEKICIDSENYEESGT